MEPSERRAASPQDKDVSHSAGQTCINQLGTQRQPELQQPGTPSLQLGFQDSNMSPALSLLPGMDHNLTEFSFLQQSETEFAPLRAYPDVSMASERFPSHDYTTHASAHASLSQHPLAQAGILSEEGESSYCSLSQHSLSPGKQSKPEEKVHPPVIVIDAGSREKDPETLTNPAAKLAGDPVEDETLFLSKDIPAQHLLELLQKDVGMLSSSSSAVSSASETSVKRTESSKSHEVSKLITQQSTDIREGPRDEAAFPQQQTQQHDRFSALDQPHTEWEPTVSNITMGSRSTQPDESSEMLHRELLSEVERCTRIEAESKNKQQKHPTPPGQSLTPYLKEMPEAKPSVSRTNVVGMQWTGSFSAGVERVRREQDLWSSGNQTGIDGSYLGFLPQSQSTPGVFNAPTKFSVKAKLGHLSSIESNKENSYQSRTEISLQPVVPIVDAHNPDTATECQEDTTSAKVHSLPSLNYMQKVDAWRANQSSGKMSLFDSLALQGFSGIPPKQKAYDAVSDSLNRLVSQKVRSLQQPLVSGAATQTSSTAPSGTSSPRRTEAVGSAPTDEENTGSAVPPSASPIGRSQSHSSLSTVVMSVQKDQQIDRPPEKEKSQSQDDHDQTITGETSHLTSLGHFSDVSLDRDLTLSSSQDSYSRIKLGPSTGTSSVVSLEIDNYVPSWTSKLLTPPPLPKPRELNIDERIPLYLRNLGIDQSPSTILTPFAPRGPIREPEFSPTEFCTIKGSTGTPTKSSQPSEGGSPHKEEFSRSSILSVDSSISIPFSLDSLGPVASIPEHTMWTPPPSDTEASQSKHKLAHYPSRDENTHYSALQPCQQQKDSSLSSNRNIGQLEDKYNSDVSSAIRERHRERNLESLLQTSRSTDQSAEDSFVSSKALLELRKLVSHAETMISTGSSVASSTSPIAPDLLSDQDILLSLKKKNSRLQDLSSSSCTAGDHRTCSSLLWTRSSSDPMLTSEKMRQSSVGQEGVNRSLQLDYPSAQTLFTAQPTEACKAPQDSTVSGVGTSLVLSKSALRTEPEGCSAAPPDKAPTQPAVISPPTAARTEELISAPADSVDVPVEEELTPSEGAAQSRSSSPILKDTDQEVMSDGSSESSLTARVDKLLQSDSPSTMVSSTPSITDQEEGKAREWIKLKLSGQQCEPLQLDEEDRRRIEEIKRELLLKNPIKSQFSTDTDSSAASSVKLPRELDPPQPVETFAAPNDAINQPTQLLHSLSRTTPDSSIQQQTARQSDLEARVCEIAAREGVTLPTKKPQAFTSITIGTRRRSPSPSPSTSPAPPVSPASEPLHLTELSTEAVKTTTADRPLSSKLNQEHSVALEQTPTKESLSVYGPNSSLQNRNQNITSQSAPGSQKRQDTVGGQFEEPLPPSHGLDREDVTVRDNSTQLLRPDSKISASGVGVDPGSDQATGSSTVEASVQTGHVSHVHLTLSPKAADRTITTVVCSSHVDVISGLPRKEFVPLRHLSSAASSPDEGVGLSSPPEWCNTREPLRQWPPETVVPQGRLTTTSPQSFTPCDRSEISPRPFTTETPVPVLLPYKPRGSEEVFYVPQTEADVSSMEMSDTTMESTHTGSDDAVAPRFSSDVLGNKDPGLDRGVTIRHTEGIYSKRLKTVNFTMQENGPRDASIAADKSLEIVSQRPKPSSQVSFALTREPLLRNQETFKRDQGTSPIQFLQHDQPESRPERFQPFDSEMGYSKGNTQRVQTSEPQTGSEQQRRSSERPLDQLWQKFCDQWTREELCPTNDREASLLERLERLSRLIHSTRGSNVSRVQEGTSCNPEQKQERRREDVTQRRKERKTLEEIKRSVHGEVREQGWKVRGQRKTEPPIQLRFRVDESSRSAEEDSHTSLTSSFSHSSSQNQHPSPTDRDESETLSTTSGSMSTVDTARLLRVFGPDKVQRLKTTSSLSKLYNTINKQKEEREERRGRSRNPPHIFTLSATTSTADQSVAADSTSSTSTYTAPSHHGPSRNLRAKKAVKLVNKSIQAGDLEIVHNGTRRHTRDVGTTFPSPGGARAFGQLSFSSSSVARGGGQRSPPKVQGVQKQRRSKRTPPKAYPKGVSWFIAADGLGSEARKENQPQEERPSIAWFEPYSRINPWRQPLRQRQVHEDTNQHHTEPDPDPKTIMMSSGLAHMSLQEALEMRRPEFISRSRQRVNRLTLQVEERKLQAAFTRERGELFNQPGGPARLPRPAGTALLRRAVPRKEMIQRSKQIYENLPEVQRRREEERRKAEYHTYRLNAQLFNKRITNRVLGRRSAWQ